NGGYLLGGYSESGIGGDKSEPNKGSADFWIVRIDKDGNKIWDKTIGGTGEDRLSSMIPSPDGGYLLGGTSNSEKGGDKTEPTRGGNDFWLVKIDKEGDRQ